MKIFIFKMVLFLVLAVILGSFLSVKVGMPEEFNYVNGIKHKHQRLDSLSGKRVILAGGSNIAFGLDSKTIQDSIHLPVTNMALHAGLGLEFVLGELCSVVREGDIVFISPEYYVSAGRYDLMKAAASFYPPASGYFPDDRYSDFKYFFESRLQQIKYNKDWLLSVVKTKLTKIKPPVSVYDSTAFNTYGDVVSHLNKPAPAALNSKAKFNYTYWDGIEKINAFAAYAASRGVKVFFLFPAYAQSALELNKAVIGKLQQDLQKDLHIPILNTPEDFVYADTAFFDTVYHLKKVGREDRTKKFIGMIKSSQDVMRALY